MAAVATTCSAQYGSSRCQPHGRRPDTTHHDDHRHAAKASLSAGPDATEFHGHVPAHVLRLAYGLESTFHVFTASRRYNLTDVVDQITTPLLITEPEGEQFCSGQSQQLFENLPGTKRLVRFTADGGADRHCEPMARSLLEQRMLDWLDETLAAATS